MIPKLGHLCWDDGITIFEGRAIVDRCQYMKARRGADHVACDAHNHRPPHSLYCLPLRITRSRGQQRRSKYREVVGRLRGLRNTRRQAMI